MLTPSIPPGSVRGGKEEVRAASVRPYLLRLRVERGEGAVRTMLAALDVDPGTVDSETAWISAAKARRILRAVARELGQAALTHCGRWAMHPEALGTRVRMLRGAHDPVDAYRYLADNSQELTRIGVFSLEDSRPGAVRVSYRRREDSTDDGEADEGTGEALLCAARQGELASYPIFWGLDEATVTHPSCIARGDDACVYEVRWSTAWRGVAAAVCGAASAVLFGGAIAAASSWLTGLLAGVLGGVLGAGAGLLWERGRADTRARAFEKVRIAALERSLQLRGETGAARAAPGELGGTVLGGKYRIGRKIGSGGIGVVYAAEHATLGHEVAVKVLRGAAAKDGSEIARLRREAHIQVHVDHPNVARVLDLDQLPDGSIYVVMERLHGHSLADKMAREGVVAPGFAIRCFADVCHALAAAHAKGVVHRDLKPGNIFLCDDGTAKVLDFGMSKLTSAESLTQAGYTLGTPEYMAPEQCIGAAVEARTDLYTLGVVMYEALTGELPIHSKSRRELLDLHQRKVPQSMRVRRPDLPIPEALDVAVMTCLRKRPSDRPADAEALAALLEAIPAEDLPLAYREPVRSRRGPPAPSPSRHRG